MNSTPFWRCPRKQTSPATSTPVASSQESNRERMRGACGFVASTIHKPYSRVETYAIPFCTAIWRTPPKPSTSPSFRGARGFEMS
jgi:hypothetical protein